MARFYVHEVRSDGNEYFWGDAEGTSFAHREDAEAVIPRLKRTRPFSIAEVETYEASGPDLEALNEVA